MERPLVHSSARPRTAALSLALSLALAAAGLAGCGGDQSATAHGKNFDLPNGNTKMQL